MTAREIAPETLWEMFVEAEMSLPAFAESHGMATSSVKDIFFRLKGKGATRRLMKSKRDFIVWRNGFERDDACVCGVLTTMVPGIDRHCGFCVSEGRHLSR